MRIKLMILLALALAGLTGCASLQPREGFAGVAGEVSDRTGARIVWNQGTDADRAATTAVNELLAHELSADAAVQVALLNNRSLQATYEELGIAQAQLVQAGLISNPVFSALVRFPDGGGDPDVELSVTQNFIELLSLPLRKNIAAAQYETAKARVAEAVISLAADVKRSFYMLQASEQVVEMRRSVVDAASASFDAASRIRAAGNTTELAVDNEQALLGQAKLDLAQAQLLAIQQREHLIALLGLWGPQTRITIAARLPELPAMQEPPENVESLAISHRLDLAAAVRELNANYQSLGMARRFSLLGDAELQIDTEHDTDGSWLTGPGVSVPIPIFDTGAAKTSIAAAKVRQSEARVYALAAQIRSEARAARATLVLARERASFYQSTVLPLRRKITQQTQLQFNAMSVGIFQLLDAKRQEIDAGRDYIDALRDYWLAQSDLERALGGRIPSEPATTSQSQSTENH